MADGGLGGFFDTIVAQVRSAMPHATPEQHGAEAARRMHQEMVMRCTPVPSAGVRDEAGVSAAPVTTGVAAEPWQPGPPSIPGMGPQGVPGSGGPQPPDTSCGCIADSNPFLGFVGEEPAEPTSASMM
jgi:hypothetical protein